jgi:hypothetical protein
MSLIVISFVTMKCPKKDGGKRKHSTSLVNDVCHFCTQLSLHHFVTKSFENRKYLYANVTV